MSSKTLPKSISDRLCIALSFAFVGPFIGSVAVFAFILLMALLNPTGDFSGFMSITMLVFFMGYIFGIGPALVAGLIYALLPGGSQRLIFAPILGAASVSAFYMVLSATLANPGISPKLSMEPMMLAAGAISAFICAWIARRSGWTPDHGDESARTQNAEN